MSRTHSTTTTPSRADPPPARQAPSQGAWWRGWLQFPAVVIAWLAARVGEGRARMREEPDAGYSTETVLVTALLVALAIGVIAIIAIKVTELANSITLG